MRRRLNSLIPIEEAILEAGIANLRTGSEFHGFVIASAIRTEQAARRLTAHGTLYKALARLEERGLLASRWEDPAVAADERRPRRRLYKVTPLGEQALADARRSAQRSTGAIRRPGLAGS